MSETENPQTLVLEIFEKGRRFTEELISQNEKLRRRVAGLSAENMELRALANKPEHPEIAAELRQLRQENEDLRAANQQLKDQFVFVEEENREFAERYVEVEKQNSDLINLYVSSHRLHSTLNYDNVVQIMKEIVINMVGSEDFGIFVADAEGDTLRLIAQEGHDGDESFALRAADPRLLETMKTAELHCDPAGANGSGPIACIPLKADNKALGVIGIWSLLLQKNGFESVDYELFELLGNHAATALYSARLFSELERKKNTLQGFINMIKSEPAAVN